MKQLFLLLGLLAPARAQEIYDLLLKHGTVVDPANHRNGRLDVAVIGNKIARVAPDLPAAHARIVVEAGQYYVTPGLIDIHAHFSATGGEVAVQPDQNSLPYGVTTAVDAGSYDSQTFAAFEKSVIRRATTRLLVFLNAGDGDAEDAARVIAQHGQTIVGVAVETPDPLTIKRAVAAAERTGTVLMVSAAQTPVANLRRGDIQTQMYSRKFAQSAGAAAPMVEARQRGVLFDVGHGPAGFWFRVAGPAIRQGFLPDTISTGLERDSATLPRATMTDVMSKLLNLGMNVEQVVERATLNPAHAIRRADLGTLAEGAPADIALLELQKGNFGFLDSGHARLTGDQRLRCVLTVRDGAIVWDSEGLAATDSTKAGQYSNYK